MLSLREYHERFRSVCLDRDPEEGDLSALCGDAWRWLRYRRMVRRRLRETLEHAFPLLGTALGEPKLEALVERFLEEAPPKSPYLRDVAGEFADWIEGAAAGARKMAELPAYAVDLARFEWAKLSIAYAADDALEPPVGELTLDRAAVLTAAHRVLRLRHAVHRFDPERRESPLLEPTFLCVYRDPLTHQARVLELTPVALALLEEIAAAGQPLADCIRRAAARERVAVDRAFLDALSDLLADFAERGLIRGSRGKDSNKEIES